MGALVCGEGGGEDEELVEGHVERVADACGDGAGGEAGCPAEAVGGIGGGVARWAGEARVILFPISAFRLPTLQMFS